MIQDTISPLNLARKWRSQTFDQIIGQDLVIRILKNSLYKSYYFPVYLFMGQRGCGKTSTARVFAASVNCEKKALFQKDPRSASIPCLTCYSCTATKNGQHPDFIEIDAASHTGVDNVRQIIDSASFMPVLGEKKIYLIDEAHMLSKAAFNALLKILEEPPLSVIFILATTDAQKILDTVRSRCFQLFFKPVETVVLADHLIAMCDRENIGYDRAGIACVVQQSQGSVRDAQNMIEQIRFTGSAVTKESVLAVLGSLDDEHIAQLLLAALYKTPTDLFALIQALDMGVYNPVYIWKRLHELLRTLIWYKYTKSVPAAVLSFSIDACAELLKYITIKDVLRALEVLYAHEALFAASSAPHAFLEMILLQICQTSGHEPDDMQRISQQQGSPVVAAAPQAQAQSSPSAVVQPAATDSENKWRMFVAYIEREVSDQLVVSLFKQAVLISADARAVIVSFGQEMEMFGDQLLGTQVVWSAMLHELFGAQARFVPQFDQKKSTYVSKSALGQHKNNQVSETTTLQQPVTRQVTQRAAPVAAVPGAQKFGASAGHQRDQYGYKKRTPAVAMVVGKKIDISDTAQWPMANMVLSYFPGRVSAIQDVVIPQKTGVVAGEADEQHYMGDG